MAVVDHHAGADVAVVADRGRAEHRGRGMNLRPLAYRHQLRAGEDLLPLQDGLPQHLDLEEVVGLDVFLEAAAAREHALHGVGEIDVHPAFDRDQHPLGQEMGQVHPVLGHVVRDGVEALLHRIGGDDHGLDFVGEAVRFSGQAY